MKLILATSLLTAFVAFFVLLPEDSAWAQSYRVAAETTLRVDIFHPTKHVIAQSNSVNGEVSVQKASDDSKVIPLKGNFSVAINSLVSGNGRRDRVMRQALGINIQPLIQFAPVSLNLVRGEGTISGIFTIRKRSQQIHFQIKTTSNIDGKQPIKAEITGTLKCSDFGIPRPSLLFVKIKDEVQIRISLYLIPN